MKFKSIADIPKQIVFRDDNLSEAYGARSFYLRLQTNRLETVDLDNVSSFEEARELSISMGYNPTHWAVSGGDIQEFI